MAEGVFWVVDPGGGGYEAGDAIAICEDHWPWSERELTHPGWAIALIGVDPHRLAGWTTSLSDEKSGKLLLLRERGLDPHSAIFAYLRARAGRGYPVGLTAAQTVELQQALREKPIPGRVILK